MAAGTGGEFTVTKLNAVIQPKLASNFKQDLNRQVQTALKGVTAEARVTAKVVVDKKSMQSVQTQLEAGLKDVTIKVNLKVDSAQLKEATNKDQTITLNADTRTAVRKIKDTFQEIEGSSLKMSRSISDRINRDLNDAFVIRGESSNIDKHLREVEKEATRSFNQIHNEALKMNRQMDNDAEASKQKRKRQLKEINDEYDRMFKDIHTEALAANKAFDQMNKIHEEALKLNRKFDIKVNLDDSELEKFKQNELFRKAAKRKIYVQFDVDSETAEKKITAISKSRTVELKLDMDKTLSTQIAAVLNSLDEFKSGGGGGGGGGAAASPFEAIGSSVESLGSAFGRMSDFAGVAGVAVGVVGKSISILGSLASATAEEGVSLASALKNIAASAGQALAVAAVNVTITAATTALAAGAASAVGFALAAVVLGAVVSALAVAVSALTAAITVAVGAMAGLAAGIGVVALAFIPVMNAFSEFIKLNNETPPKANKATKATNSLANAMRGAEAAVRAASRGLADAKRNVADAAQGILDAARNLRNAKEAAVDAAQGVEQAKRALRNAGEAVTEAIRGVSEAQRALADAGQAVIDSQQGIVDAQNNLRDAGESVQAALRGVTKAEQALVQAESNIQRAIENVVKSQKNYAKAGDAVAKAQARHLKAREALTKAEEKAKQNLIELGRAARDAAGKEEDAEIRLIRAREKLMKLNPLDNDQTDYREALRDVEQAERDLSDIREDNVQTIKDFNEAQAKGISGSDEVKSAQEALADAAQNVADAQEDQAEALKGIAEAQKDVTDAVEARKDAEYDLAQAKNGVRDAIENQAAAQRGLDQAVRDYNRALENQKDAEYAVGQAKNGVRDAIENQKDAQDALNDSLLRERDAKERIGDAERDLKRAKEDQARAVEMEKEAQLGLQDAILKLNETRQNGINTTDQSTAAQRNFNKAFGELTPIGQEFVNKLKEAYTWVKELQAIAQDSLLPGLGDGMQKVIDGLGPIIEDGVKKIGTTIGGLASELGTILTSDTMKNSFTSLINTANDSLKQVGGAFNDFIAQVTPGMAALGSASGPVTGAFAQGLRDLGASFAYLFAQLAKPEVQEAMASTVKGIVDTLGIFVRAIGDFSANTAESMTRIGPEISENLGKLITGFMDVLTELTNSGLVDDFLTFVGDVGDTLKDMAESGLIEELGKAMGATLLALGEGIKEIFSDPEVVDSFIELFKVMPPLIKEFMSLIQSLLPVFSDYLKVSADFTQFVSPAIVTGISVALEAMGLALKGVMGFAEGVGVVFQSQWFKTLAPVIGGITAALWLWINATKIATLTTIAFSNASKIAIALQYGWNVAMAAFNVIATLNPFGLVVLAIAAVIAVLVLAYKNFEPFRKLVDSLWESVKGFGSAVADLAVNLWDGLVEGLKAGWKFVSEFVGDLFNDLIDFVKDILGIASPSKVFYEIAGFLIQGIVNGVKFYWELVKSFFKVAFQLLTGDFSGAWKTIVKTVDTVFSTIQGVLDTIWKNVVRFVWTPIKDFVTETIPGWFTSGVEAVRRAWAVVQEAINSVWNTVKAAVWKPISEFIMETVPGYFRSAVATVETVWGNISGAISRVWNSVTGEKGILGGVKKFVTETIPGWFDTAVNGIEKMWDGLKNVLKTPINMVIEEVYNPGIVALWNNVVTKIPGVKKLEPMKALAHGGTVDGVLPGNSGMQFRDDRIASSPHGPIALAGGEYVVNAPAVKKFGVDKLDAINSGRPVAGFAEGGWLGDLKNIGKVAGGAIRGALGRVANPILDGLKGLVEDKAGKVNKDRSNFSDLVASVPLTAIDKIKSFISGDDEANVENEFNPGGNTGHGGKGVLLEFGKWAEKQGYTISEHSYWNGGRKITGGHSANSKHYTDDALDINRGSGTSAREQSYLDDLIDDIKGAGLRSIWRSADHFNHLHVDTGSGDIGDRKKDKNGDQFNAVIHNPSDTVGGGSKRYSWMYAGLDAAKAPRDWAGGPGKQGLYTLISRESNWNPRAQNNWDSNAKKGQASRGLMQTIPSTFAAYREKSLPNDIFDPVANIAAGVNYIQSRYGSIWDVQQANPNKPAKGYRFGGLIQKFAQGGLVSGPGGPVDDQIEAMLSNGEFVVNAAQTQKYLPTLQQINDGTFTGVGGATSETIARFINIFKTAVEKFNTVVGDFSTVLSDFPEKFKVSMDTLLGVLQQAFQNMKDMNTAFIESMTNNNEQFKVSLEETITKFEEVSTSFRESVIEFRGGVASLIEAVNSIAVRASTPSAPSTPSSGTSPTKPNTPKPTMGEVLDSANKVFPGLNLGNNKVAPKPITIKAQTSLASVPMGNAGASYTDNSKKVTMVNHITSPTEAVLMTNRLNAML